MATHSSESPELGPTGLPPYGRVLAIRPEVHDPRGLLDMVDIASLTTARRPGLRGRAPGLDVLCDPAAFFDITYPTQDVVETLRTLSKRVLDPTSVSGTLLLSGRYGLGKSHVLVAAHHALHAPAVVEAWATRWRLEPFSMPDRPIVLTRSFIHDATTPLWSMLLLALAPDKIGPLGDFVDGQQIERLLGDRPVFLIMDEVERWYDTQDERTKSKSRNFLQALTEVSARDARLTVLATVLDEHLEPGATIRRVRPLELAFRSAEDRQRIVQFRLFKDRESPAAEFAAKQTATAYVSAYRAAGLPGLDSLEARFASTWPFTPEFLDLLTKKVPNVANFQNTRGLLRLLAHVVRVTCDRRPVVSSQDLPLDDPDTEVALTHIDVGSGGEIVKRALHDNRDAAANVPHRDSLFSALVLYSIADPTHPGATLDELLLATLDPGENPLQIRDALQQLRRIAFNLHMLDNRFVFQVHENPSARIAHVAQNVGNAAVQELIGAALKHAFGAPDRTVYALDRTAHKVGAQLNSIPGLRFLVSGEALVDADRLRLQNEATQRNLVLLVEPSVRTGTGEANFSIYRDEELRGYARQIDACTHLLEGKPPKSAAEEYARVKHDAQERLRKAVQTRFGTVILWHRAGATGQAVDDSWYEVERLRDANAASIEAHVRENLASSTDVVTTLRKEWRDFSMKPVRDFAAMLETQPGRPIPVDLGWAPKAARDLAREGVFGLRRPGGEPVRRAELSDLDDAATLACLLVEARAQETLVVPRPAVLLHEHVAARWDTERQGVALHWRLPDAPDEGHHRTRVERYTTARGWEVGKAYPLSTDSTHEASRFLGEGLEALDTEGLLPGELYHYYVFLVHERAGRPAVSTLSQRCDVAIPKKRNNIPGEVETPVVVGAGKLVQEIERLVRSGKQIPLDARVRKVDIRIGGVASAGLRSEFAKSLDEFQPETLSADLHYTFRGDFAADDLLKVARLLPRMDTASYWARLTLRSDSVTESEPSGTRPEAG